MTIQKLKRFDSVKKSAGGAGADSQKFYGRFVDHKGIDRRIPLFSDRKASNEMGRKIATLVNLRAANETTSIELTRWIETTTPFLRGKLAEWDLIASTKLAASKPLTEHVEDFKSSLAAKGNTTRHAELVSNRAGKVFDSCGFKFWSDITASAVQSHLQFAAKEKRWHIAADI